MNVIFLKENLMTHFINADNITKVNYNDEESIFAIYHVGNAISTYKNESGFKIYNYLVTGFLLLLKAENENNY